MWVDVAILVFILFVIIVFSAQLGRLRRELHLLMERKQRQAGEDEQRLLLIYQSLEEAMEVYERYAQATREELERERESLTELSCRLEEKMSETLPGNGRRGMEEGSRGASPAQRQPEPRSQAERAQLVLQMLSQGRSAEETARLLGISKTEIGLIAGMRK